MLAVRARFVLALGLLWLTSLPSWSQNSAESPAPVEPVTAEALVEQRGVEEIFVTARKREEDLQEVPLAITAFGETQIDQQYGNDIGELTKYTPNVVLARNPYAGNALFGGMRGIVFADLEKSFDPAAGVVVDGVALVTSTGALIDTFDLESIEVLRGPQGTLYGRNTIAGLVNVRRTRPTKEWGLKAQARYGSYDEMDFKVIGNAPIGETIGIKIGAFYDKSDGFTEDAVMDLLTGDLDPTGHQTDGEDTINIIGSALWEPREDMSALFTYEYTDDDSTLATPTNLTVPYVQENWGAITGGMFGALFGCAPGDATCQNAAVGGAIGATLGGGGNFCDVYGAVFVPLHNLSDVVFPQPIGSGGQNRWNPEIACARYGYQLGESNGYKYSYTPEPFVNKIKQHAATLELNFDVGQLSVTSITGYRQSDELLDEDNLGAAVPIYNPVRPQSFDQFSTELRAASNFDGRWDFVAGIYYVESEYEITASVFTFGSQFPPADLFPPANLPPFPPGTPGCLGCFSPYALPSPDSDAGQDLRSVALFGEAYVDLSEKLRLTVGARWTWEEKEFWIFYRSSGDTSGLLPPGVTPTSPLAAWGCGALSNSQQEEADEAAEDWIATPSIDFTPEEKAAALVCNDSDGRDTWSEITPRIAFDYHITDDIMAYASWSRGFRSGGWNGRAATPSSMGPYDPETVDNYEAGLRSEFFDNRLQLNLTYFHAKYDDKQESQIYAFGNSTETIVDNAASAVINGIELESQLIVIDNLSLRATFGWTKGYYDAFEAYNRVTEEIEDVSDIREFGFAPEFNVSVGADYRQPLPMELGDLHFMAHYAWFDGTTGNFGQPDPEGLGRNVFDSRGEADFTLAWENKWLTIAAFVKDAFHDDNFLATSVDVGVFWFGATAPGRTWGVELTKEF